MIRFSISDIHIKILYLLQQAILFILVYYLIFVSSISLSFSQTTKGATPIQAIDQHQTSITTYALIVGISDYQDPSIPDLKYADKDAEAFSNFLRTESGGKLDKDHLKVLINEKATMAQFAIQLDWLMEKAKENDRIIIYFSGHGDVEKRTISQPGFLLFWDAPSSVYMAGGAFNLSMLQEVISTLSIKNKAKVIMIADACHSGTLAGNSINGTQATTNNLAKQFANEVKILSCQPNEYSIEGQQWGGGRGAFSYHLMDALYGLADNNNDLQVNLMELGRYLEDHVTRDVAPLSQVPMIIGNRAELISHVDTNMRRSIQSGKMNHLSMLSPVDSKGIEEQVLTGVDSSIRILYDKFNSTLRQKQFLSPANNCVDYYYSKLIVIPQLSTLFSTMKRNYAAALQEDAQQVMNKFLKSDIRETALTKSVKIKKYKNYPAYLSRAAELLGPEHYMYNSLLASSHFFKGYLLNLLQKDSAQSAIHEFRLALSDQADLPHAYWQISAIYALQLQMADSAEYYAYRTMELAPNWALPFTNLTYMYLYSDRSKQLEKAKKYLDLANKLDSTSINVINEWGVYYFYKQQYDLAETYFNKSISMDSNAVVVYNLALVYAYTGKNGDSEKQFIRTIQLDSTYANAYYNLACLYNIDKNIDKAYIYLEKALVHGYRDYNWMIADPDLALLKTESTRWKQLLNKYFK